MHIVPPNSTKLLHFPFLSFFLYGAGFDPDASSDVNIDSVFVHSNDDSFAVKALLYGRPTQRVRISNAVVSTKKSAFKVGTESKSGFNDILFENLEAFDIDRGLVL